MAKRKTIYFILAIKDAPDNFAWSAYNATDNYMNTYKFFTIGQAIAFARKRGLNPLDFEIREAEFSDIKILRKIPIEYGETKLSVAE